MILEYRIRRADAGDGPRVAGTAADIPAGRAIRMGRRGEWRAALSAVEKSGEGPLPIQKTGRKTRLWSPG
jgi:hypothetical protein